MATPTFRPLGKPTVVEDAKTLLKTVTRQFVVPGPLVAGDASQFFLARGTADAEYADCILVDQKLQPANDNSSVLVQTFQQLGAAGVLVPMYEFQEAIDDEARLTKALRYIVRLPYAADAADIGTLSGGLVLAKIDTAKLNDLSAIVTKTWVQATDTLTEIGNPDYQTGPDGRKTTVRKFIQRAAASFTEGVVGTDTYSGAILAEEKVEVTSAVRLVSRTYVVAGEVARSTETKNNGKLSVITVQTVNTVPSTPVGYTVVQIRNENVGGIPSRTYVFAKGSGRVSLDTAYRQNGKLKTVTIRYLDADDGVTPSGTLTNDDSQTQDGYTVYTKGYTEIVGDGVVSTSTEVRNSGKMVAYRTTRLGAAPTTPTPTIGGTVVALSTDTRAEDGFVLYDYRWVEGIGRISADVAYRQNGKLKQTSIRYLESDSEATPAGTLIREETEVQSGVTLYSKTYAEVVGDGIVLSETETRNVGKLVLYRTTKLGSAPSAPAATIGGSVVLVSSDVRQEDGVAIYDYRWAEGDGRISTEITYRQNGKLQVTGIRYLRVDDGVTPGGTLTRAESEIQQGYTIYTDTYTEVLSDGIVSSTTETRNHGKLVQYRITRLGSAPDAPAATIGGTVTLVQAAVRQEDGVDLYDYTWAEGYGRISIETRSRNNGALTETNVRYIGTDDGSAPSGVLVSTDTQKQDGVDVTTKIYASGSGQVSQEDESRNNGKLLLRTIRHLTAPAASNPVATPSGYAAVNTSFVEQDGHRLWTATFAKGEGRVSLSKDYKYDGQLEIATVRYLGTDDGAAISGNLIRDESQQQEGYVVHTEVYANLPSDGVIVTATETKNHGKLVVTRITRLGSAPGAPSAAIGGTVVLVASSEREEDGFVIYERQYAEGYGRISTEVQTKNGGALVLTTVRYLDTDDVAAPSGTVVSTDTVKQDGVDLTTKVYASGSGEISRQIDYSQSIDQGTTGITRLVIRHLTSVATVADPTSAGGYVKVGQDVQVQDGMKVWTVSYAKGTGTIVSEIKYSNNGLMRQYHRVALGAPPATPTAVLGGSVIALAADWRLENGVEVYDYRWAEGAGTVDSKTESREDGSLVYTVSTLSSANETPAYPGSGTGYLVGLTHREEEGVILNQATYIKPPPDFTRPVQVDFNMPGLIVAANPPTITPPITLTLMGTEVHNFDTIKTASSPYTILGWASLTEEYYNVREGRYVSEIKPMNGYLGDSVFLSSSPITYRGIPADDVTVRVNASNPTSLPTGTKIVAVRVEKYLTATDGTTVWRNMVTEVTLP